MAGNIKIVAAKDNYQRVAKGIIFDDRVDVLTLGLYVKVLCLGKEWNLNVKGLATTTGLSADKVRKCFAVLEEVGYLRRTKVQGDHGHFSGWDYEVYSTPITDVAKTPTSENTDVGENRTSESTDVGFYRRRENDTLNRDINNKIETKKEDRDKNTTTTFTPPSVDEVAAYAKERGFVDPEGFADYYVAYNEARGWKMNKGKAIVNWKLNVISWEPNNKTRIFRQPSTISTSKAEAATTASLNNNKQRFIVR